MPILCSHPIDIVDDNHKARASFPPSVGTIPLCEMMTHHNTLHTPCYFYNAVDNEPPAAAVVS